ncbi:hypothetical protein ACLOJK_035363 [Asimina triloba]
MYDKDRAESDFPPTLLFVLRPICIVIVTCADWPPAGTSQQELGRQCSAVQWIEWDCSACNCLGMVAVK